MLLCERFGWDKPYELELEIVLLCERFGWDKPYELDSVKGAMD